MNHGTCHERAWAPHATAERIHALDVLRGFALFGIVLMNIEFFARPLQDIAGEGIDSSLRGLDYAADWLVFFFVQSKFWALFSLLFGMGFAVLTERASRSGRAFVPIYLRRTLALLGIGMLHALLVWSGDILVTYALGAMALLAARQFRRWRVGRHLGIAPAEVAPMPAARLARWGLALYCVPLLLVLALAGAMTLDSTPPTTAELREQADARTEQATSRDAAARAYAVGHYAQATRQRVRDTREELSSLPTFLPFLLGVFLLGAALVRAGVGARPQAFLAEMRWMRNLGLPVGFGLMALSVQLGTLAEPEQMTLRYALQVGTFLLAGLLLALAYAATLVLALQGRAGPALQRWLAPAGRMALSNYLLQSIVLTLVFYGYGLGWFERMPRAWQLVLACALFALQLLASRWWLARFGFGPAEWLWRWLTYGQWPSLRA